MTENKSSEGNKPVKRRSVLKATGATALGGTLAVGATGTAAAWGECDCVCYKLDRAPRKGETFNAGGATITITDVTKKEGREVVCFSYSVESCTKVCKVKVKGGPDTNVISGEMSSGSACAPEKEHPKGKSKGNSSSGRYGISHVTFCVFENCDAARC